MCKVIAVAMQKGGCAKTSVSLNLGIGLARAGKKEGNSFQQDLEKAIWYINHEIDKHKGE